METNTASATETPEVYDNHEITRGTYVLEGATWFTVRILSPQAKAWGRRFSPGTYFRFDTPAKRETYIAQWKQARLAKIAARKGKQVEKRAAAAAFVNPYTVGQVLHSSWGYDQTNVEFFEVLKVGPRSLQVCEISAQQVETGNLSGRVTALPGKYVGEPVWVTIQVRVYDGKISHSVPSPIHGYLYTGGLEQANSWGH